MTGSQLTIEEAIAIANDSEYGLSAGVWSLSDVSGDTIPRGAWRRLQGSSVRLDAGEYQYCIDTSGGLLTLNEVDGVATLEDPE